MDQVIDAAMARGLHADACRSHALATTLALLKHAAKTADGSMGNDAEP